MVSRSRAVAALAGVALLLGACGGEGLSEVEHDTRAPETDAYTVEDAARDAAAAAEATPEEEVPATPTEPIPYEQTEAPPEPEAPKSENIFY